MSMSTSNFLNAWLIRRQHKHWQTGRHVIIRWCPSSPETKTANHFQVLCTIFSFCLAAPAPDADPAPAAYASDYTQYFAAPEPAPSAQFHSQDDAGEWSC